MADFAPTRNSYTSTSPVWARDLLKSQNHGILIDGTALLAAFPTGIVPSGTGIMRVTATKLGAPVGTAGATPEGYLINELKVVAGGRYLEAVMHLGTVTERLLPGGAAPAGFKAALPRSSTSETGRPATMQIRDLVPDLTATILAAREQRDARNTLARYLPNTPVADVSYRLGRQTRLDQRVPVRALDAPATPIRRPGLLDVRGDLPAVTPIEYLTETDLTLAQRLAGIYVNLAPSVAAGARNVALTVDNTFELMRGQLLSTGIVSLELEDGNVRAVDFAIPAGQKVVPAASWTLPGTDVFADLLAWHNLFLNAAGSTAGVILTSTRTRSIIANKLQTMFPQQPIGSLGLNQYLAVRDLPPIETNDRTLTNQDGSRTRVYPENSLTFLPAADVPVGRTFLGVTQEAVQQVENRVLTAEQAPGLTIVTLGQDNPVQRAVKGAAIGLPVLQDTDVIVCASGLY